MKNKIQKCLDKILADYKDNVIYKCSLRCNSGKEWYESNWLFGSKAAIKNHLIIAIMDDLETNSNFEYKIEVYNKMNDLYMKHDFKIFNTNDIKGLIIGE